MDRRLDPRHIVTPYAFAVHPDLLGRPLATPGQRLGAILVDLVVIGFISIGSISQIGVAPLAIASTALLFWLASRKSGRDAFGKMARIAVGCLGFLILTTTLLVILWLRYGDDILQVAEEVGAGIELETEASPATEDSAGTREGEVGFIDLIQGFRGVASLQNADTREEAQPFMNEFVQRSFDAGLPRSQIRDILRGIVPEEASWAPEAEGMMEEALGRLARADTEIGQDTPPVSDEQVGPGEGGDPEPSTVLSTAAVDSIQHLNRTIQLAQEDRADAEAALERTRQTLEEERNQGPFDWLWGLIDDLGIGFGWAVLYLTITHAWWKGTSVGKKLFRIRVVMIDKRPLNWWLSFERAGGYAAGLATGLLGFAQIFWDPNRQAIHDKVAETIVVQDGREPLPGPWIEEGKAQWVRGRSGFKETPEG